MKKAPMFAADILCPWQARVVGFPPKRVMEMEVPWLFEDVLPGLDPGSLVGNPYLQTMEWKAIWVQGPNPPDPYLGNDN